MAASGCSPCIGVERVEDGSGVREERSQHTCREAVRDEELERPTS